MKTMKRMMQYAMSATVGIATLAGCAKPITHIPEPGTQSVSEMRSAFRTFDPSKKERQVGGTPAAALAAVERVRQRVMPAAQRVCVRYFSSGCAAAFASMKVRVDGQDETINAFAAIDGTLGFYGGLVRLTGNDDELAAVMAHEVAHILFGHNQQAESNTGGGMLLGAVLGLALGASTYEPGMSTDYIGDLGQLGMNIGGGVGAIAYSPEMELEADHFAVFVLAEAGYDPEKGGKVFVRMSRRLAGDRQAGRRSFVSYFATHPGDDRRLALWYEAVAAVRRGQHTPITAAQAELLAADRAKRRKALAARKAARARYNSAHCVAVRKEYPDCKWWKNEEYILAWGWGYECPTQGVFPLLFPRDLDCAP